jgi:hypothetical protein
LYILQLYKHIYYLNMYTFNFKVIITYAVHCYEAHNLFSELHVTDRQLLKSTKLDSEYLESLSESVF